MKKNVSLIQKIVCITLAIIPCWSFAITINVTTTKDELNLNNLHARCIDGIDSCSFREAVQVANELSSIETINLPAGIYELSNVGYNEDNNETGDIDIYGPLIIKGANSKNTIIDGIKYDRILHQHKGYLKIFNVTLQNGQTDNGGAIASEHTANDLHLNNSRLVNNFATKKGGAIDYSSTKPRTRNRLFIRDSEITDNSGESVIHYINGERLSIERSLFERNSGETIYATTARLFINGSEFIENGSGSYTALVNASCNSHNGSLTIENSQFNNNSYIQAHGAIVKFDKGDVATGCSYKIDQSEFTMNTSNTIVNAFLTINTHMDITESSFEYNTQYTKAGEVNDIKYAVISIDGNNVNKNQTASIENSTIANNLFKQYGYVSALYARNADVKVLNSTISSNAGRYNTILSDNAIINLQHVTLADNLSSQMNLGGLNANVGTITLKNTLMADIGVNCFSDKGIISLGHNLDKDGSCSLDQESDITGFDPLLMPLANNGGNTKTHALQIMSPAVNHAENGVTGRDQRGLFRPYGLSADIGAFELLYLLPLGCTLQLNCYQEK